MIMWSAEYEQGFPCYNLLSCGLLSMSKVFHAITYDHVVYWV